MRVAFIGLGVMGFPMAGHLAEKGHLVTVYNRTRAKAEDWSKKYAGSIANTPSEAASEAEIVFSCVGNDDDVREVLIGKDGALASTPAGSIIVDHTTASADVAREVAQVCSRKSAGFLDAPLSGGEAGAVSGQLTVMAGGEPAVFERAKLAMASYAKAMTLVGGVGTGQIAKMVNQICIAGVVQGLAEALHFARRADVDIEKVIAAISKGAAQSWQMENRWETMVRNEFDFGFAVDWMRKDLGIALAEAEKNGATLELTKLVDEFYSDVQSMGGNRWDTSSLIARLEK
ncbi:MAG: NAD(P)-dependent oxidoreductase [Woeseiaceae bacterium]|nr:NAD(P)-dependent oxidoreductase [Woeseiaceae bacterium]